MKQELITANWEYTDTFGGEANYSWVRRGTVKAKTERRLIRAAKKAAGLNGVRGRAHNYGDTYDFRPYGCCTVLFVTDSY